MLITTLPRQAGFLCVKPQVPLGSPSLNGLFTSPVRHTLRSQPQGGFHICPVEHKTDISLGIPPASPPTHLHWKPLLAIWGVRRARSTLFCILSTQLDTCYNHWLNDDEKRGRKAWGGEDAPISTACACSGSRGVGAGERAAGGLLLQAGIAGESAWAHSPGGDDVKTESPPSGHQGPFPRKIKPHQAC